MKYSVKELAELTHKHPETIKRWIYGIQGVKLKATRLMHKKNAPYEIDSKDLRDFIQRLYHLK
jgi:hypothetical protein